MYFLGYSDTSKAQNLYDEVNNKFVLSRYVIFLEINKFNNIVDNQLTYLVKFTHLDSYHEFDNKISHLEGGIPILDLSLKSPLTFATLPQEQVPSSSEHEGNRLDDVIERIGRLGTNKPTNTSQSVPTQSTIQPKSSKQPGTS